MLKLKQNKRKGSVRKEIMLLEKELKKLKKEHKIAHNDADSMQKAL